MNADSRREKGKEKEALAVEPVGDMHKIKTNGKDTGDKTQTDRRADILIRGRTESEIPRNEEEGTNVALWRGGKAEPRQRRNYCHVSSQSPSCYQH